MSTTPVTLRVEDYPGLDAASKGELEKLLRALNTNAQGALGDVSLLEAAAPAISANASLSFTIPSASGWVLVSGLVKFATRYPGQVVPVRLSASCYVDTVSTSTSFRVTVDNGAQAAYRAYANAATTHQGWSFAWLVTVPTPGSHVFGAYAAHNGAGNTLFDSNDSVILTVG